MSLALDLWRAVVSFDLLRLESDLISLIMRYDMMTVHSATSRTNPPRGGISPEIMHSNHYLGGHSQDDPTTLAEADEFRFPPLESDLLERALEELGNLSSGGFDFLDWGRIDYSQGFGDQGTG